MVRRSGASEPSTASAYELRVARTPAAAGSPVESFRVRSCNEFPISETDGRAAAILFVRTKELPKKRMHFHHLFSANRLVHLDHDSNREQHSRARGVTDRPYHV